MKRSVLLIDDDVAVLGSLESAFRRAGYSVTAASTGSGGLDAYAHDATDIVILDLKLTDMSGLTVLARLRDIDPDATVIMLTGYADLGTAVKAMRAGAENFLPKPVDLGHLFAAAERGFEKVELLRRTRYLEERARMEAGAPKTAGSGPMDEIEVLVRRLAPQTTTVLILGETGTGKSWLARRVHELSPRAAGPFVEVNAAALTSTFLEAELFGHEKGAFTDAKTLKRGLFEVANGGTLFLDEIGDLDLQLQPKLLHVIEEGRFRRIGGTRDLESDARIVAATNRDLAAAAEVGDFREDLYYRLAVLPLTLPPLRERGADQIAAFTASILEQLQGNRSHRRKEITPESLRMITRYSWPGNLRELRNVLERALILSGDLDQIQPAHLPSQLTGSGGGVKAPWTDVEISLEDLERRHILRVLEHCDQNRTRAAEVLGISRGGLYKKLARMDTEPS